MFAHEVLNSIYLLLTGKAYFEMKEYALGANGCGNDYLGK